MLLARLAACLVLCVCLLSSGPLLAQTPASSPHDVIRLLMDEIYVAGETGGKSKFTDAIERRRAEMQVFVRENPASVSLIERNPQSGMTPLLFASSMGYAEIVAELLKSELVVAHINDSDKNSLTPWMYANLGWRISIWACNPKIWNEPMRFIPYFVTFPVYLDGVEKRYHRTRRLLQEAGAFQDAEAVRTFWLNTCVNQSDETRSKVTRATDLLNVVTDEGIAALDAATTDMARKLQQQAKPAR
jgi:ankyrin repeat protein